MNRRWIAAMSLSFLVCISAQAASPKASESARKESASDREVVKEDVDRMKEEVTLKKTQSLLFKQFLKNEAFESNFPIVNIVHQNDMTSRYQIYSIAYLIDQDRVYTYYLEDNIGKAALGREFSVYKGPLVPGLHELVVEITYRGNDTGVFNYINDYKISLQAKENFKLDKGRNLDVRVVGYEKGWALSEFKDRPVLKIKFRSPNQAKDLR